MRRAVFEHDHRRNDNLSCVASEAHVPHFPGRRFATDYNLLQSAFDRRISLWKTVGSWIARDINVCCSPTNVEISSRPEYSNQVMPFPQMRTHDARAH